VGGIANSATLTVSGDTLGGNSGGQGGQMDTGGGYCGAGGGGALVTTGVSTISASAVISNTAAALVASCYSGGDNDTGGIANNGALRIEASTISGNTSVGYAGAGGINNSGALTVTASTIVRNSTSGSGGGIATNSSYSTSDTTVIIRSILANNSAPSDPDCAGTLTSGDYNLIGSNAGCAIQGIIAHNMVGLNPLLGPLQDNGGPTYAQAALDSSPVIDWIPAASCAATDQRGTARPDDGEGACDIGAVESSAGSPPPSRHDVVLNGNDGGPGSLREVVADANRGDTITFAAGVVTVTLLGGEIALDKDIMIVGAATAPQTISGSQYSRVFEVKPGVHAVVTNLIVRDGQAPSGEDGGGILNRGALDLRDSAVVNNAIGPSPASCSLLGCGTVASTEPCASLMGCDAGGSGGGIANSGTLTVTASSIISDTAGAGLCDNSSCGPGGSGGGIANSGTLTVTASSIISDTAGAGGSGDFPSTYSCSLNCDTGTVGGAGGGVANTIGATAVVSASTIADDAAGVAGQVFYSTVTTLIARPKAAQASAGVQPAALGPIGGIGSISGAGGAGGGVSNEGTFTIVNSTISGNTSGSGVTGLSSSGNAPAGDGAGLYDNGALTISNSTIVSNTSGSGNAASGGGIATGNGTTTIGSSIVAGNMAATGNDCSGNLTSHNYNLIEDTSDCTIDGATAYDVTGIDPRLGPLQDNGGPTYTDMPQPGSPALDRIPLASCPGVDQRGATRPGGTKNRCDIGSVETPYTRILTLQVLAGAIPAAFFPQGGQTTVITDLIMGPPDDPTFAVASLVVTTTIADSTGAIVWTLAAGAGPTRGHWRWDGHDGSNLLVAPGVYTATVQAAARSNADAYTGVATVPITVQADGALPPPCQFGVGGAGQHSGTAGHPAHSVAGVNTASGNYLLATTDLLPLTGPGIPLAWTRYYNSQCAGTGPSPFGPGWTFTYNERLILSPDQTTVAGTPVTSTVTHVLDDGTQVIYTNPYPATDGSNAILYTSPLGTSEQLRYEPGVNGGQGVYRMDYCQKGCQALYNTQGQLTELRNPHSSGDQVDVTILTYNNNGLTAVTVTDGAGHAAKTLTATSDPTSGRISDLSDPAGRHWRYSYDANDDLTSVTDPMGHVTRYSYGSVGQAAFMTPVAARTARMSTARFSTLSASATTPVTPTAPQLLTGVQDAAGGGVTIGYDGGGRATNVTDAQGHTTAFSYTSGLTATAGTGVITATLITDPQGGTARDYYDDHGRLRRSVDATGAATDYNVDAAYHDVGTTVTGTQGVITTDGSVDANGDQTSAVDGQGNLTVNTYDAQGNLVAQTDARGFTTSNGYDAQGDLITSTDTLGNSTIYGYDGGGNQISQTDALGRTTVYTYDASGDQTGSMDSLGNTTTTGYDTLGRPVTTTDALGDSTTTAYDTLGHVIAQTDALGRTTRYGYDALGRTIAVTDAAGNVTQSAYDTDGHVISTTDALGAVTTYGYDALGRTTAVTDALGDVTQTSYDGAGRVLTSTDPLGNVTVRNTYDTAGQLVERDDALGHATTYGYDLAGRPITQTDALGAATTYGYDDLGRTIAVTDALGNVTQSAYDGAGRLLAQEDALGAQTAYGYDSLGQTVAVTDALGNVTRSAYDPAGRLLTSTDALGAQTAYGYDALGRTVAVTDALGSVTTTGYDAAGQPVTATDALGRVTTTGYDTLGRTIAVTDAAGNVTHSSYDANGRLLTSIDALGVPTSYGYDALGRTVAVTNALGAVTTSAYDADGRLLTSTDALGAPTAYGYDALGQTTAVTDALGGVTQTSYDADGRVVSSADALGNVTRTGYDALGRTVAVTDANNHTTATSYDALGRTVAITDARGYVTQTGYDALGRTVAVTDALGGVTGSGYDADGRLITGTDALGAATTYGYDALGRTIAVTDALGNTTGSGYDAASQLVTSTDALGNQTAYGYDALGRTTVVTDALGRSTASAYDAAGRLLTRTDALGGQTTYGYDALGRTVAVTDALGAVTRDGYDLAGRLLRHTDALGNQTAYGYDALGRTVAVTDALGNTTTSSYDAAGRVRTATDALGDTTAYGYDGVGQTVAVTDALGAVTHQSYDAAGNLVSSADPLGHATQYSYDPLGRRVTTTNPNGHTTTTGYDAAGRVVARADALGDTTAYSYDALGQTVAVTDAVGAVTRSAYDADGRLVGATDALGNVTTTGYDAVGETVAVTDALGRVTHTAYDALGRAVQQTDALGHATTTGYDALGRTIAVTDALGNVTRSLYDADGRLLGGVDALGGATTYGYDALGRTVAITDALGTVTHSGYDPAGRLAVRTDALGHATTYGYDALGRTVAVTDALGQATHDAYDLTGQLISATDKLGGVTGYGYDAAGNRVAVTNPNDATTRYGYDAAKRLITTTDPLGDATITTLDAAGRATRVTDVTGRYTATRYDADGRVVATDDGAGHLTTTGYDAVGQTVAITDGAGRATTYGYDAAGRQTSAADALGDTTTTAYDALGQPVAVTDPDHRVTRTSYDALGRPSVVTDPAGGATTTGYDTLGHAVAVTDPNGHTRTRAYDAAGRLVTATDALHRATTYGYDALGQAVAVTDGNGHTARTSYDAAGQPLVTSYADGSVVRRSYDAAGQQTSLDTRDTQVSWGYDAAGRTIALTETVGGLGAAPLPPRDPAVSGQRAPASMMSTALRPSSAPVTTDAPSPAVSGRPPSAGWPRTSARMLTGSPASLAASAGGLAGAPSSGVLPSPLSAGAALPGLAGYRGAQAVPAHVQSVPSPRGAPARPAAASPLGAPAARRPAVAPTHLQGASTRALGAPTSRRHTAARGRLLGAPAARRPALTITQSAHTHHSTATVHHAQARRPTGQHPSHARTTTAARTAHVAPRLRYVAALTIAAATPNPTAASAGRALVLDTGTGSQHLLLNSGGALTAGELDVNGTSTQAVWVNSAAVLSATTIALQGGLFNQGGTVRGTRVAHPAAFTDPWAGVTPPTPPSATCPGAACPDGTNFNSGGTYRLLPGHYTQGLNLNNGATICVAPGVYVLDGSWSLNTALHPYGSAGCPALPAGTSDPGVLLYFHSGAPQLNSGGDLTQLVASTTGAYAGLLVWIASATNLSEGGAIAGGGWYQPSGSLTLNAGARLTVPWLIAHDLDVNGTLTISGSVADTPTATAVPSATPTATSTATAVPTRTASPSSTATAAPTDTATPTATLLSTDTATATTAPTHTVTVTAIPTNTATAIATATDTPTNTATPTATATSLPTDTPTNTATATPLPTDTATATPLPTDTATATPILPTTMRLGYTYDAAGRRTGLVYPDGTQAGWGYDAAGQVSVVTATSGLTTTLTHDGAGNLTALTAPNGGAQTWRYDGAGRLTATTWVSDTTTLFSQTATLDPAGQRVALDDSWGHTAYGYDNAGRLTSASYPDGTSEANQYDAAGNRLVVTGTSPLSGTAVTTNQYDAADQLVTSATGASGVTTYSYDGNGNQTGSMGPSGVLTTTYNDLNQLTQVSGPTGTAHYVSDGQGDRLRALTQNPTGPAASVQNLTQDLVGGLSSLASDGTQSYTYLTPGNGQAPLSSYNQSTGQSAYLATDLGGSVRLATNGAGQVIGAGAYDAWGTARPTTPDSGGQTMLAGLQGVTPFGYAGQYRDAGPGTYNMRAREYDPTQGRFLSVDPLVDQTGQPYAYANNNPLSNSDPSGLSSGPALVAVAGPDAPGAAARYDNQAARQIRLALIAEYAQRNAAARLTLPLGTVLPGAGFTQLPPNGQLPHADFLSLDRIAFDGHLTGEIFDLVDAYQNGSPLSRPAQLSVPSYVTEGLSNLQILARAGRLFGSNCRFPHVDLALGNDYTRQPGPYVRPPFQGQAYTTIPVPTAAGRYVVFGYQPHDGAYDGTVLYSVCRAARPGEHGLPCILPFVHTQADLCQGESFAVCAIDQGVYGGSAGDFYRCHGVRSCLLSSVGIAVNSFATLSVVGDVARVARLGIRIAAAGADAAARAAVRVGDRAALGDAEGALRAEAGVQGADGTLPATVEGGAPELTNAEGRITSCNLPHCFPAGTLVAMPHGHRAIEKLHVGDLVLAEDPKTRKVEPEPVQALIVRPRSELMALDLADGSVIKVQPDHIFWVDSDPSLHGSGWLTARRMHRGDRLHMLNGRDVVVVRLRWHVGRAVVYTLTVAHDHTFFVGSARVLVHNANDAIECSTQGHPFTYIPYGGAQFVSPVMVDEAFDLALKSQLIRDVLRQQQFKLLSVAIAKVDGKYVVAFNRSAYTTLRSRGLLDKVANRIRDVVGKEPFELVDQSAADSLHAGNADIDHAEQILYHHLDNDPSWSRQLGVSNFTGPCDERCRPYFPGRKVAISYLDMSQGVFGGLYEK